MGNRFSDDMYKTCAPPPGSYNYDSDFSKRAPHLPSFSFGISRDAYEKTFQRHAKASTDRSIPGPGTYTISSVFSSNRRDKCYSLKGRGKSMQDLMIKKKRDMPGPGQYSPRDRMNKDGVYKLSSMRSAMTLGFHPSERFKTSRLSHPGPGHYCPPDSINSKGSYFVSNFKNSGVGYFGTESRTSKLLLPSTTPGPGNYDATYEIGFVEKNLVK